MKVAFDEEVGSENVETLRKLMNKVRNPPSIFSTFAFTGHASQQVTHMHKDKEKNATLRSVDSLYSGKQAVKAQIFVVVVACFPSLPLCLSFLWREYTCLSGDELHA